MTLLEQAREKINAADESIAKSFESRMKAVKDVIEYKMQNGLPVFDGAREKQVLERNLAKISDEAIKPYYCELLCDMMDISKNYQHEILKKTAPENAQAAHTVHRTSAVNFIKDSADKNALEDAVFSIVRKAKLAKEQFGAENVVDATLGSLYDEDGKLVAYKSVFDSFDEITPQQKAAYAGGFLGNEDFRTLCSQWALGFSGLYSSAVATPGGTGAVSLVMSEFLETGESVIIPDIAWTSYAIMAQDKQLKTVRYNMFDSEDNFNLDSIKAAVNSLKGRQNRIVLVINDPCHNPTGYSMSRGEWAQLIEFLNEVSRTTPCIILNDNAYIDYSFDLAHSRDYVREFDKISENIMVVIAMSCSKTLTSYGMRCGAAVIAAKNAESVKLAETAFEKSARATWSNVNNGAMLNFTNIMRSRYDEFMAEKNVYIDLLKKRSSIFIQQAQQCGLPLYPYKEGFFVTVKADNRIKERYHELLMQNNIFTVLVDNGIRVAVCSLPTGKADGLAKKMKDILTAINR